MGTTNAIDRRAAHEIDLTAADTMDVVYSVVTKGDISQLDADARTRYYVQMCESLGLSAAAQPFAVLKLNGKEILYPTRGATDQLAAIHRLNREIIDGPKVIDVGGSKIVYAVCKVTHPNGRVETSTGMVPLPSGADNICNAFLKTETKARRRGTLSILGLGMLDESELDTIPASAKGEVGPVDVRAPREERADNTLSPHTPSHVDEAPALHPVVQDIHDALLAVKTPHEVVCVWVDRDAKLFGLAQEDSRVVSDAERQCVQKLVVIASDANKATSESSAKAWLKEACVKERARRKGPPPDDGPKGGGRKPRAVPSPASAQATAAPVASNDGPQSRIVIDDPQTMARAYLADFARGVDLHAWSSHVDSKRHWHAMLSSLVKRAAVFDAEGLLPDRTHAVVDAVARSLRTTPELARAEMRRRVGEKNSSEVQALLLPVLGGYAGRRAA